MRSLLLLSLCCLALTSLLCSATTLAAADTPSRTSPTITAIDIERVYVGAHLFSQRFDQLQKEVREAQAALQAEGKELKGLVNSRKMMARTDTGLPDLLANIEVAKLKLKLSQKKIQARLLVKESNIVRNNTTDLRAHLATYAQEKNIGMVIRTISGPLRGRNTEEMQLELTNITAYYVAPRHDITDDFIGWLNAKFPAATPAGSTDIEVVE